MRLTNFFYFLSGMIFVQVIENIIAVKAIPFCQNSVSSKSIADERTPTTGAVSADTAAIVADVLKPAQTIRCSKLPLAKEHNKSALPILED